LLDFFHFSPLSQLHCTIFPLFPFLLFTIQQPAPQLAVPHDTGFLDAEMDLSFLDAEDDFDDEVG
jgi:hypothetical protein